MADFEKELARAACAFILLPLLLCAVFAGVKHVYDSGEDYPHSGFGPDCGQYEDPEHEDLP